MYTLKQLELDLYTNDTCIYCNKTKNLLKNHLEFININENEILPKGIEGVLYFYSNKTKQSYIGNPSSIDELVDELNKSVTNTNTNTNNNNLSIGAIIGISLGSITVGILMLFILKKYLYKNK